MKRSFFFPLFAGACAALTVVAAVACNNSTDTPSDNGPQTQDSGAADTAVVVIPDTGVIILPDGNVIHPDSAPPPSTDCFPNPTNHFEIINACTTAQAVDKHPSLPLLLPDGGLPPPP